MSKKLIICSECEGTGMIEHSECTSYHNGDYKYWDVDCGVCEGSGRLIEDIVVKTKAYKPPKKKKRK